MLTVIFCNRSRLIWLGIFILTSLVACNTSLTESIPTYTNSVNLIDFHTPTPSRTQPPPTPIVDIPITPAPTATPFTHMIEEGDTMLGIALQYGINLEDLQAANPDIDPRFLSIGTQMIIPIGEEIPAILPTPTPETVNWFDPLCYLTGEGGAWCFLLVENENLYAVENVSARIGLFTEEGESITGKIAITPLNQISPGSRMPVVVFFPPPLPLGIIPRGDLLTALKVQPDDTRYLTASVSIHEVEIQSPDRNKATVTGEIQIQDISISPSSIWLVAVAYDEEEHVVGVRKLEADANNLENLGSSSGNETTMLDNLSSPEYPIPFEISVYSLDSPIERVEVLVEMKP
jgi:LysM repeat protein